MFLGLWLPAMALRELMAATFLFGDSRSIDSEGHHLYDFLFLNGRSSPEFETIKQRDGNWDEELQIRDKIRKKPKRNQSQKNNRISWMAKIDTKKQNIERVKQAVPSKSEAGGAEESESQKVRPPTTIFEQGGRTKRFNGRRNCSCLTERQKKNTTREVAMGKFVKRQSLQGEGQ